MFGKPWFLSVISGVLATLLYFAVHRRETQTQVGAAASAEKRASIIRTAQYRYALVFVSVAFLVYGSFTLSISAGACRMVDDNIDIQTGGCPPF